MKIISLITLFALSFSVNAMQTKQEIIESCKTRFLTLGGNHLVLTCIKMELQAQREIEELRKQ